jgi:predicted TIM-barrel fold metal-dependent hydrolase
MRTITLEEHITTPEFLKALAKVGSPDMAGAAMQAVRERLLDMGDRRLADMDAAGIDVQVLSLAGGGMDLLDAATATTVARDVNDRLADAVRAHPDRFAAFATLALQDPERAALEFERCITRLHFKGALVNGTTNGAFLDDPRFAPIFETAERLAVPIYLHPAPPPRAVQDAYFSGLPEPFGMLLSIAGWGWHTETGLHCLRLIVAGVFDRFPGLQVIIGHMGEDLPYSLARANAVLSQASGRLKRSVAEAFHANFHVTTSGYFTTPPFLCALMVVGADRLMFSVDYPFSSTATGRAFLDALPISPGDREKIAHANAARLLKL